MITNFDIAANVKQKDISIEAYIKGCNYLNLNSNHLLGKKSSEFQNSVEKDVLSVFNQYNSVKFVPGGGTNANKFSILNCLPFKPKHRTKDVLIDTVLISSIEHKSISTTSVNALTERGYKVFEIPVNRSGKIVLEQLEKLVTIYKERVALVSVIFANNEIGVVQDLEGIISIINKTKAVFHSDITQGVVQFINSKTKPDIVTTSCYKFGGPHVGLILYDEGKISFRKDYLGTPDVSSNYAASVALKEFVNKYDEHKLTNIKLEIKSRISEIVDKVGIHYRLLTSQNSVPHILSFLFPKNVETSTVQRLLGEDGVCVGVGSACLTSDKRGSRVVRALGYPNTHSLLRISFDQNVVQEDVDKLCGSLEKALLVVKRVVRNFTPIKRSVATEKVNHDPKVETDLRIPLDLPLKDLPSWNCIKLSVAELYLKGGNRDAYLKKLFSNLKKVLPKTVRLNMNRNYYLIDTRWLEQKDTEKLVDKLQYVSGISNVYPGYKFGLNAQTIFRYVTTIIENKYSAEKNRFKIRTSVKGSTPLKISSTKWNYILGQYIMDRFDNKYVVDLNNADICVNVDIYSNYVFVYVDKKVGFGGLPVGTEGRILSLLHTVNSNRVVETSIEMANRGADIDVCIVDYNRVDNNQIESALEEIKRYCNPEIVEFTTVDEIIKGYDAVVIENKSLDIRYLETEGKTVVINNQILQNKYLCLISGGLDSPVAAYILQRLGRLGGFIHFTTDYSVDKILEIKDIINKDLPLFIVNFKSVQEEIVKVCPEKYRTIMYKVFMVIIANRVAKKNKYDGLITGNSWGQVASQTPKNILVTRCVSDLPLYSPLLGWNKDRIVSLARKIGTYQPSICDGTSDCCVMYLPKHPVLKGDIDVVKNLIDKVNPQLLEELEIKEC